MWRRKELLLTGIAALVALWLAQGVLDAVIFSPIGDRVSQLLREGGAYDYVEQTARNVFAYFIAFVTQTWVLLLMAFFVGLAAGMGLEKYLRYRDRLPALKAYRSQLDPLIAFTPRKRRVLTRDLRRLNSGEHNVHLHIANAVDLPFAKAIASCFQRAGWKTRINTKPRLVKPGSSELCPIKGFQIEGYNANLIALIHSMLSEAGISCGAQRAKANKASRDSQVWNRIDRRVRIWIGPKN
jgi:hypothetical protein